ncbi:MULTISPECIES: hypothetical protein [Nocardia]|uniref:IrrE N-terminal-like domain-containing protein n=1 Tax=Nocardia farcinica TaxID=37329 RepID=A0A449GGM2_NOCFR|nr:MULTISPECIES: hypothetical protein [Nocardia]MBF6071398.1 hypothetical protein [Nocardia farcinica]MBF6141956.1 hypothetical protein [Nocardia farcinica]MBF6185414.1 hypothetical protein [Nocardia farcinica]MBF6311249.1 hypothetical protein [Nocardia farcinica]MBF6360451.1 hypothetical protein [Nocardia farcinica]
MTSMEARLGDATRTVPLPSPWDVNEYLARVAAHRGRSISLRPVPAELLAGNGCRGAGLWVSRRFDDIIVYDAEATDRNADHIILHEIGHMLLGHGPADDAPTAAELPPELAALVPAVPGQHVLGRAEFGQDREQEAEVFADMTMVYATLPRRRSRGLRRFGRRR